MHWNVWSTDRPPARLLFVPEPTDPAVLPALPMHQEGTGPPGVVGPRGTYHPSANDFGGILVWSLWSLLLKYDATGSPVASHKAINYGLGLC